MGHPGKLCGLRLSRVWVLGSCLARQTCWRLGWVGNVPRGVTFRTDPPTTNDIFPPPLALVSALESALLGLWLKSPQLKMSCGGDSLNSYHHSLILRESLSLGRGRWSSEPEKGRRRGCLLESRGRREDQGLAKFCWANHMH